MLRDMTRNNDIHASSPTRQRLLEAAGGVFARRGYTGATTEEICREAGVNNASICYYFGGKENLYREVWRRLTERDEEELNQLLGLELPPDEKLLAYLRIILSKILSDDEDARRLQLLVYREMASPSPINQEIFDHYLQSARDLFVGLLDSFFGRPCSPFLINQCFLCLQSSLFWLIDIREKDNLNSENLKGYLNDTTHSEELAANLLAFSMGGMRALRDSLTSE